MGEVIDMQMYLKTTRSKRIDHYGGYCYGWGNLARERGLIDYVHAVVMTPKYAGNADREVPDNIDIVLDNGAYPAWNNGEQLTLDDQIRTMNEARDTLEGRLRWVVMPDVVGSARRTWRRVTDCLRRDDWTFGRDECLLPVQDGMRLEDAVRFADKFCGGIFIGGSNRRWKFKALERLRKIDSDVHLHIARISSADHLAYACELGADSYDTTTYYYSMGSAPGRDFKSLVEEFCTKREDA